MSAALFPARRRADRDARIDLLCSTLARRLAELFTQSGEIDNLYALPLSGRMVGQVWRLVKPLRANRYDAAVDLRGISATC